MYILLIYSYILSQDPSKNTGTMHDYAGLTIGSKPATQGH